MSGSSRRGARQQARPGKAGTPGAAPRPAKLAPMPDSGALTRLLEPVVHAMDMDLESLKVTAAGRRRVLRVVVDSDRGVSLDDIALASRELSARLDAGEEMGDDPYTLEVSSPGTDRPLTQPRHWRRNAGRLVQAPGRDGGTVSGRITRVTDAGVTLERDGQSREYSYQDLGPGRVEVEFGHLDEPAAAGAGGPGEED